MTQQKVLLLTGVTNLLPLEKHPPNAGSDNDVTYEEVFEATLGSKIKYTKSHGYDLMCLRSFGSALEVGFKETNVGLLRMFRSFEMLNHYDVVMWIDADSVITNDQISAVDFGLDDHHCFYASYDWPNWAFPTASFNTGNFILKKNKNWENLFRVFLMHGRKFAEDGYWEELATMKWIHTNTEFRGVMKILDHKFLQSIPETLAQKRQSVYGDIADPSSIWNPTHFLCHMTGLTNKNRIELMNTQFRQYL